VAGNDERGLTDTDAQANEVPTLTNQNQDYLQAQLAVRAARNRVAGRLLRRHPPMSRQQTAR
jgi:cytochrome c553